MLGDSSRIVGADGRSSPISWLARVNPWLVLTLVLLGCAGEGGGGCGTDISARLPQCPRGTVAIGGQCAGLRHQNKYTCRCTCPVVGDVAATADLDVCVTPAFNVNLGGQAPSEDQIVADCSSRVATRFQDITGQDLSQACTCTALDTPTTTAVGWDTTCDAPCNDASGVCVVAASDPSRLQDTANLSLLAATAPAPDTLSSAVFGTTSICQVDGTAGIDLGGHKPETQPTGIRGVVQIRGRPCPQGPSCQVGLAYQLEADNITFDSGSIFADDVTLVDLTLSGATAPNAVTVTTFLGCCIGALPTGTAVASARGRQSGSSDTIVGVFTNAAAVAGVIVDWANKTCALAGTLTGSIKNGDREDPMSIDVSLTGALVNQPPHADAGKTKKTVQCTSPQGAVVTLDGSGSSDADTNIAYYVWRRGSGSNVADPSGNPVITTQQALGGTSYALRVVDDWFAADTDTVAVSVVDTTQPTISCNAPATITPSDVPEKKTAGLSFKATASDVCTGVSRVAITGFTCTKPQECEVQIQGDTITIFDSGGVGDTISWTVSAQDGAGNAGQKTCQLNVIKKK